MFISYSSSYLLSWCMQLVEKVIYSPISDSLYFTQVFALNDGSVAKEDGSVIHRPNDDISDMLQKMTDVVALLSGRPQR